MRRRRTGVVASLGVVAVSLAGCGTPDGTSHEAAPLPGAPVARAPTVTPASPAASARPPALTATPSPRALGPGEGLVTVLTYRGYAENGTSDQAFNWVGEFERRTGCRVNLRFPESSGEMDKLLARTPFDVVSASPELAGRLIAERKVAPLTPSLIPRYGQIPGWLRAQRSITEGSQVYGIPYLWGYYLTLYEGDRPSGAEGGSLYSDRGPVMLRDDPLSIADAALALKRQRPELGVRDPFQLTVQQLDAALALLAEHPAGGRSYWKDPVEALQGFAGGGVRAGRALPYTLEVLRRAGRQVKAVADEPTTGWVDAWMVSAQAAAPKCAYRWLDWVGSAKVQQQAALWNGLAPANPRACAWEGADARRAGRARRMCEIYRLEDDAWIAKIRFAARPSKDCGDRPGECAGYAEWAERWERLAR